MLDRRELRLSDTADSPPDALIGQTVAGRYRVERLLGSGGMGTVYRAEHVHMRKAVALKVMHPELARLPDIAARFEREAIAAGRIDHPNVATATDFGQLEDGSFYLVLEYVEGKSLRELLRDGPLPLERALGVAAQIASALAAAHEAGIVHRDLKPDNVMLVPQADGTDRVKVLDFGIAKLAGPDVPPDSKGLTRVGVIMGTAEYMSPEQAIGQPVDERTDLYALGVVLYEMLAGHVPFQGESAPEILTKQLTEAPPPLTGIPSKLTELLRHLLEKNAGDRPASARAVLERLESGFAITVPAPPPAAAPATAQPIWARLPLPRFDWPRQKTLGVAIAAAAGLLGIGAAWAVAKSSSDELRPLPSALPPSTSEPAPATVTSSRVVGIAATATASAEPEPAPPSASATSSATSAPSSEPVPASSATTTKTQSKSQTKARSSTQKTTTKKTTKRKTGPGGIYIPPPSEWF